MPATAFQTKGKPFEKGNYHPGPGRPKGSGGRSVGQMMRALMEIVEEGMRVAGSRVEKELDYRFNAKDSPESKYMAWLALKHPELYVTILSHFLPNKLEVDISSEVNVRTKDIPTREELRYEIEQMGLPPTKVFDLVDYSKIESGESDDSPE